MYQKSKNRNLNKAKKAKNDEFYTQLSDIENELKHYRKHFENKTVLCNCDDPRISNFFHYFSYNFEFLGLKKLIATCYKNQKADLFSRNESEKAICLKYEGDKNGNRIPDFDEINIQYLKGDGDFRSKECIELLKQSDIIVTNPPFSLFREYVAQLIKYNKKFLILGNFNAVTYKEIFPLIKNNKMWMGINNRVRWFQIPNHYDFEKYSNKKIENGKKYISMGNINWFTNLEYDKRNKKLFLYKKYNSKKYPKYDNYDAINVDKIKNIPMDYSGIMGVPITFMNNFDPEQFEIIGLIAGNIKGLSGIDSLNNKNGPYINGKLKYGRILIKNIKL